MIEKPDIADEKIIRKLNEGYLIQTSGIEFLPIGNDASAFAYRVETHGGDTYFLKIKTHLSNLAGLFVSRFLSDHGIKQIIAPLYTKTRQLFQKMDDFTLILYPFIVGKEGIEVGMTDLQWMEFGTTLQQIHSTELTVDVSQYVRRETFIPKWGGIAKELHEQVPMREYADPYRKELANFWKKNHKTIQTVMERAETIGKSLRQADLEFVLCHADIHTANILVTAEQDIFIIDWDETLLAPKERDLMFVLGEGTTQEKLFFKGYGSDQTYSLAVAYYRYEWCIQEIGDYGQRVFSAKTGERTKQDSVEGFIKLFLPIDIIEATLNMPFDPEITNRS